MAFKAITHFEIEEAKQREQPVSFDTLIEESKEPWNVDNRAFNRSSIVLKDDLKIIN